MSLKMNHPRSRSAQPILRHLINLDDNLSYLIHVIFKPIIPYSLLIVLELSGDFTPWILLSLALLFTPSYLYIIPIPRFLLVTLLLGIFLDHHLLRSIRPFVPRSRPSYNINTDPAYAVDRRNSFPSGHASRVFFVTAFVYLNMLDDNKASRNQVWAWAMWVWATATSFSRVVLGRHFALDVFAGTCLGLLEASIFSHIFSRFSAKYLPFH